jgi:hypothetical protein
MNARTSHIPSCDAIPSRGRRRARVSVTLAAALLLPLPALAQEVRARDLSIIEDVLVETIQESIQGTIRAINTENLQAQEQARASNEPVPVRYVFRSGTQTLARGMFLEDYGVIFTVQVPAMAYTNSAFLQFGNSAVARPDSPGSVQAIIADAGAVGQELQMRAQMSRMDGEISAMRQRVEEEVQRSGATSQQAVTLRNSLASMEQVFDEMQRAYSEYIALRQREAESRRQNVSSGDLEPSDSGLSSLRIGVPTREEIAAAEDLAQAQRDQIEGAVIEAVVETLGHYGRIMHGLDNDDRLAVVLLPSSYLNPFGSWARATQRDEEFTISVRFRDVMDLDDGDLTPEEFGARIRIERRGQEVPRN